MAKSNLKEAIGNLVENAREYGKARLDLLKLDALEHSSRLAYKIIFLMILLVLGSLLLLFATLALALYIGTLLGNNVLGFLSIAGFYLLLMLLIILLRQPLILTPIIRSFSKMLFPEPEAKKDEDE